MIPPRGAYPEVTALANDWMSGWTPQWVRADHDLHLVGLALGLPVEAGRLERGLVRLRPPAGEVDRAQVRVGEADQLGRELDGGDVGVPHVVGEVGELLHLVVGRARQLLASVADRHVPEAGEAVDVLLA